MSNAKTLTDRILHWVADNSDEEGAEVREIAAAMDDAAPETVRSMVKRLRQRGHLVVLGRARTGKRGQPPKLYAVSPSGMERIGEGLNG